MGVPRFLHSILLIFTAAVSLAASRQGIGLPEDGAAQSQSPAEAFEAAQDAHQRGDLETAIKLYTKAVGGDPSMYPAFYQRALALLSAGRTEEAEADLRKTIALKSGFARAHRVLGQLLLDKGMNEGARREFEIALRLEPRLPGLRAAYAESLIRTGDPAAAEEQLQAAVDGGEVSAKSLLLMAVAAKQRGDVDRALLYSDRAVSLEPENSAARQSRGQLLEETGRFERAAEDYAVAYRLNPSRDLGVRLALVYAGAGKAKEAIDVYRGLLSAEPKDVAARAEMLRLMANAGMYEEAMKEVDGIIAGQPADAALLSVAGDVLFREKPDEAAAAYRRALGMDPADNRVRIQLGASLVRSMKYEEALPVLAEAIRREPGNHAAHANLATALFKLKRYPEAAGEFLWIIRSRPDQPVSYYFLAISLDHLGDCEQSLAAYRSFAKLADEPTYKRELEEATARIGRLEELVKGGKCKLKGKGKGR